MGAAAEPDGRVAAFGNQLVQVHIWLREELRRFREDVDSFLDGGGDRPRDLRTHCFAFCAAIGRHHTGEDGVAFPVLAEHSPELRPVLEELGRDHAFVAGILRKLEELLGAAEGDLGPGGARRVRMELDSLAAMLESHFSYEERRLVAALNSLSDQPWAASAPDFLPTTDG
jgi:hemerythrin-like domain-containing protein